MSLEAFLAELENQESSSSSSIFIDVARVRVFFCWQGYSNSIPKMFEYAPGNKEDKAKVRLECQSYIDTDTESQYQNFPQEGVCVHIFGDDIPTHKDGSFHWGDSFSFASYYERDANIPFKLSDEEQAKINGSMPYNLAIESLRSNEVLMDWKPHWVKVAQEVNQWQRAKGKKNKDGFDKRLYIIQQVYANEAEAKADAEKIKAGQVSQSPQVANGQLSKEALETWGDLETLQAEKDFIKKMIEDAQNGLASDGKRMPKKSPAEARAYAIEKNNLKPEDLVLIGIEVPPF